MYKKILLQIEKEYMTILYALRAYMSIRSSLKNFDPKTMVFIWKTESIVRPLFKKGK